MVDRWNALNTFWNSFGLPAHDENTIDDGVHMPYISYEAAVNDFDDKILLIASVWYYSTSWKEISQKAEEISEYIGGGVGVPYDNGRLWITKQVPFAQRLYEPTNDMVRRILIRIGAEYQ